MGCCRLTQQDTTDHKESEHDPEHAGAGRVQDADAAANKQKLDIIYGVHDVPPWYTCVLLGFQHYLMMCGSTLPIPFILAPSLCLTGDLVGISEIISTIFVVSGICTLLQTTLGVRLPIVQGGAFAYVTPTLAILSLEKWKCPQIAGEMSLNNTDLIMRGSSEHRDVWTSRMREIQGAIIAASAIQVLIGITGIMGFLLRFIGPLAIAPTITLIGLSLLKTAASQSSAHWWIAVVTMVFIVAFSQYLRNTSVPSCSYKHGAFHTSRFPLFTLFPVILAVMLTWIICAILTATGTLPTNPEDWGYKARTDIKLDVLHQMPWFRFPYPFQWGVPSFSIAGTLGMFAGALAGIIESIGDYYACARIAGAPPPPTHAVNRGIFIEGIGCLLAGCFGSGNGTTSYSANIGAIGITKVGSLRVIQVGGLLMIVLGAFGKLGALFVTIPEPVVGGVLMCTFGMVTAVGISNLQFVDLNSTRNLFIIGFSIFVGMSLPGWISANLDAINTGSSVVDQLLTVWLTTSMFLGGAVGFILDSTIPGTLEERGMSTWRRQLGSGNSESGEKMDSYDFPCGMGLLDRAKFTRYIPICPTFLKQPKQDCVSAREDVTQI